MSKIIRNVVIESHEADLLSQANIITLFSHTLDTAGYASNGRAYSIDALHEQGLSWVLSRFAIEVNRYPKQFEEITIETWIEDINKLVSTRNFQIFDQNRELIAQACSLWSMIDQNTRRPVNLLETLYKDAPVLAEANDMERPVRILEVKGEKVDEVKVRYSDIDFNQHANSARYIKWQLDSYNLDMFKEKQVKRFDINFVQEVFFGEKLEVYKEEKENMHFFDLKNENGRSVCKTIFTWEDKK
jgi:acyl-ACP thioesterase